MFSATFAEEVQRIAAEFLQDYLFIKVGILGAANQDVTQEIVEIQRGEKMDRLVSMLNDDLAAAKDEATGKYLKKTLVFVQQKRMADIVGAHLSQYNITATTIHGDREQQQREEALGEFKRGIRPVLVATAVASRGLDIVGVDHVINYDLPGEIDEYVHRIGRTGRVGNPGRATSFYDPSFDAGLTSDLIKILKDAQQIVPDWLQGGGGGGGSFGGSASTNSWSHSGGGSGGFGAFGGINRQLRD